MGNKNEIINLRNISSEEYYDLRTWRWKARTDLGWLCREILNYPDVSDDNGGPYRALHQPLINILQKFPSPTPEQFAENDKVVSGKWDYQSLLPLLDLPGGRRTLILDFRGSLKCVTENNTLSLADGTYRRASEISIGTELRGINDENFELNTSVVTGIEKQAPQDCYKISFSSGRTLELSHNHPLRMVDGWHKTEDIRPGDKIAQLGFVEQPKNAKYLPEAELLGWLVGDGSMSSGNCLVTNDSPFFRAKILKAVERAGGKGTEAFPKHRTAHVRICGLRPRLRELGLDGTKSDNKFVPKELFEADNQSVKEFLYGYFMADGTARRAHLSYTTKSHQLALDIQKLLLRFSIPAYIHPVTLKTGPYAGNTYFYGHISSQDHVKRFFEEVGWDKQSDFIYLEWSNPNKNTVPKNWRSKFGKYLFGRDKKPKHLTKVTQFHQYDISKPKLRPFANALGCLWLQNLCTDNIFWDEVVGVEYVGKKVTWAIETSTGNFGVEDIVTHNTTINSVAHTIQWIINYPDIAILIFMASDTKSGDVMGEIKKHFQYNPKFRMLFPEHCPTKNVGEWGTMQRFTTEARRRAMIRKEPTVMTGSIEKGAAGYHFDIIKFSDIVDENNTVGNGLETVRKKFDVSINLLKGTRYWMDVEGTRYHFADTYGKILEREMEIPAEQREYKIHLRSIFQRNIPGGEKYGVDDMKFPFLLDETGKRIPWWPERWSLEGLEKEERYDSFLFSAQKLNWPISSLEGGQSFPVNKDFPKRISRDNFEQNIRIAYKEITVDLAETDNKRSNYTAIIVGAIDHYGRLYVEEIIHGRFLADVVIGKVFQVAMKHYRHLRSIKFEKSSYLNGLMPSITRVLDTQYRPKGINFNIETIQRSNRQHKADRIAKSLQPFYKNNDLFFLEDIDEAAWRHMVKELEQFPNSETDDILDALSDFLSGKDYFGREQARANPMAIRRDANGNIDPKQVQDVFLRVQRGAFDRWAQVENHPELDYGFGPPTAPQDEWFTSHGIL